jgi:glycosyltransferase involved in cell wall biosynthesis
MPDLLLMFRKLNKPIITTVHTTIKSQRLGTKFSQKNLFEMERSEKGTYIMYPGLRLAEEIYFRRKRFYISPSCWMKQWLRDNFHINQHISVIPNSLDVNDYRYKNHDEVDPWLFSEKLKDKRIILYLGRLLAMKGIGVLIRAIPNILSRVGEKNLLFVFAGPGDNTRYLNLIKSMKVESSCLFTGPLPRESVMRLMRNSELLVAPSFMENSPYAILESMALGLPAIASNVGGVSEIIEDGYNGTLIEHISSKAIADAVVNSLENKQLQRLMGQRAIETIKTKFSWSANLKKYLEVYSNALNHYI